LKPDHIKGYYEYLHDRGVSNNTIIRHHANIRKALQEAYQKDLIPRDPADQVQWPKAEDFISNPYSVEEANRLLEVVKGEKLGERLYLHRRER